MKRQSKLPPKTALSKAVEPALKRAQMRAREVARRHGTPIHVQVNGKVVALKP